MCQIGRPEIIRPASLGIVEQVVPVAADARTNRPFLSVDLEGLLCGRACLGFGFDFYV